MRTTALRTGLILALALPLWGQLRVAVISDLNGHYGSAEYERTVAAAIERIREEKPDLVLSLGDMVAGQRLHPRLTRPELETMWSAFHKVVSDPLVEARIPFAVTAGNHDGSDYPGFELERRIFQEQWQPRRPRLEFMDAADYPLQYAVAAGGVLFIAFDGTRTGAVKESSRAWLKQVLAEHGSQYRRRVVFTHVPLFPFVYEDERETVSDAELEAVLKEGHVDVLLSGHQHAFYPGVEGGMLWISQPCLGAGPRKLRGTSHVSPRGFTILEFPERGPVKVEALREPDFRQTIDPGSLPESLRSPRHDLKRLDLVPAAR